MFLKIVLRGPAQCDHFKPDYIRSQKVKTKNTSWVAVIILIGWSYENS